MGRFGSRGDSTREKRPRRGRLGPRAARPVGRLGPGRPGGGDATRLVGRLGQGRRIGAGGDLTRGVIRPGRGGGARPGDVLFFAAAGFKLVCPLAACLPHSKQRRQSGDLRGHAGRRPPAMALATWVDTRYPAVAFLLPSALFFAIESRRRSELTAPTGAPRRRPTLVSQGPCAALSPDAERDPAHSTRCGRPRRRAASGGAKSCLGPRVLCSPYLSRARSECRELCEVLRFVRALLLRPSKRVRQAGLKPTPLGL